MRVGNRAVQIKNIISQIAGTEYTPWLALTCQYGVMQYFDLSDKREFMEMSIMKCVFQIKVFKYQFIMATVNL